jgi:hypothetical protein
LGRQGKSSRRDAARGAGDTALAPAPASRWPATAPSEPRQKPRKLLYYRNPMGLPDTSPVPKKDSMGMDYIAVYEGEDDAASAPGEVKISTEKVQKLGVKIEAASLRELARQVTAAGRVEIDERRVHNVAPSSRAGSSACTSMPPASRWARASRCSRCIARNWSRHSASTWWRRKASPR